MREGAINSSIPFWHQTNSTGGPAHPPREVARQLLEYESPGHTALVGIDYDATCAFLYHERDQHAIAVAFGADGLADGGPIVAEFGREFGWNVYEWVRRTGTYWSWVNPRFR